MSELRRASDQFRIRHTKEVNELCKSPSIVEIMRSKELRWRENASRMAKTKTA